MITVKANNITLFLQEETIVAITEPEATLERVGTRACRPGRSRRAGCHRDRTRTRAPRPSSR